MKIFWRYFAGVVIVLTLVSNSAFRKNNLMADQLRGAWMRQSSDEEHLLLFIDGYNTHTVYNKAGKKFIQTRGGTYNITNKVNVTYEFNSGDLRQIGQSRAYDFAVKNDELTLYENGKAIMYKRIDDGSAPLTGLWQITSRKQGDQLAAIHRTGTRKTIKILSGTRFQWAAIDPGKKEFHGTGGGTYEFVNGKYIEHIEFFSRDSARVGASLTFDGKLENGEWHHSGLSSRGDQMYEIWTRTKK